MNSELDFTGASIEESRIADDEVAAGTDTSGRRYSSRQAPSIQLPNQDAEYVNHIALDIGGSLIKLVYFSPDPSENGSNGEGYSPSGSPSHSASSGSLANAARSPTPSQSSHPQRGGKLHFVKFETNHVDDCISFIEAKGLHRVCGRNGTKEMRVKATGGGAYKYADAFKERLGVVLEKEDEMACLVSGTNFLLKAIHHEAFTYEAGTTTFVRSNEDSDVYPYLLVNIGSGVSMVKVSGPNSFERVSGSSIGGGTFWGLCRLLTQRTNFDEMLDLSVQGDNSSVDMLVGDIYGGRDYASIGLSATTIASSFGKVVSQDRLLSEYNPADMCLALCRMVAYNIGQLAHLNALRHGIKRILFGGFFIRGHPYTMETISYAIRFWSKGEMAANFLRHEGFLGAVGAFLTVHPMVLPRGGAGPNALDEQARKVRARFVERFSMGAPLTGGAVVGPAIRDVQEKVSWVEKFVAAASSSPSAPGSGADTEAGAGAGAAAEPAGPRAEEAAAAAAATERVFGRGRRSEGGITSAFAAAAASASDVDAAIAALAEAEAAEAPSSAPPSAVRTSAGRGGGAGGVGGVGVGGGMSAAPHHHGTLPPMPIVPRTFSLTEQPVASPSGGAGLVRPKMSLHLGVLHFTPTLEPFPLLADMANYEPNTLDINSDPEELRWWVQVLRQQIPVVVEKASASEGGGELPARRAQAFGRAFGAHLDRLEMEPGSYGALGLSELFAMREECLREFGFGDVYRLDKERECRTALAVLPDLLRDLDTQPLPERLLSLVEGVLAANIFDWGSQACVALYRDGTILDIYRAARLRLSKRPWAVDGFDAFAERILSAVAGGGGGGGGGTEQEQQQRQLPPPPPPEAAAATVTAAGPAPPAPAKDEQAGGGASGAAAVAASPPPPQASPPPPPAQPPPRAPPPYRRVMMFVDNSGADIVLGMVPLAREFLRLGCEVVLVANSLPAINDITAPELRVLLAAAAEVCPVIKAAREAAVKVELATGGHVPPYPGLRPVRQTSPNLAALAQQPQQPHPHPHRALPDPTQPAPDAEGRAGAAAAAAAATAPGQQPQQTSSSTAAAAGSTPTPTAHSGDHAPAAPASAGGTPAATSSSSSSSQHLVPRAATVPGWHSVATDPDVNRRCPKLYVVANGQGSPCLDLRRVPDRLAEACVGVDLLIIEGMGRAIHTNFIARFTCDSLRLAMIKTERLAKKLFNGNLYDCVCRFEPGTLTAQAQQQQQQQQQR